MKTNEILNNIIANNENVPADVLEAFRVEATESGYDLATKEGTDWYSTRSILAQWYAEKAAEEKWEFVYRHAYHPYNNRFGIRVEGTSLEERYQDLLKKMEQREVENQAFRAAMIAQYSN